MNEERRQILQMLADGKINADEAERLLSALEGGGVSTTGGPGHRPGAKPKYLRVLVDAEDHHTGKPVKVNIRVPVMLMRAGVRLSAEDQVFVAAFVRSHGSIKEMEQVFGVSYPTIKARLNRISSALQFVETDPEPGRGEVLDRLARGEITADEAVRVLEGLK